ncbi:MAG: S28 family serine protease [Coriobacteriales bacterium]|nr:S28 family serine protease [Coriobacteriales bacterium]
MNNKQASSILMALCVAVVLALSGCNTNDFYVPGKDDETRHASVSSVSAADLPTALAELEGVTSVEPIDASGSKLFSEKYLITFEQPLDHADPSLGTFPQRVVLGIAKDAEANVLETCGYGMPDEAISGDSYPEICAAGKRNLIRVEHRFFGQSVPKGLTHESVDEWKYLMSQNAADDYHHIYTELSKVLAGKWAATGASRGGEVCASYTYYYPDDMAISVPIVAPFSSGAEDPRFYTFVYTHIGDERYGEAKAKEYRELVTKFQVELMKNKDSLAPRLWQYCMDKGYSYRPSVTSKTLFDVCVLELAAQEWQWGELGAQRYGVDLSFAELSRVLALPAGTEVEKQAKRDAEFQVLSYLGVPEEYALNNPNWPYWVNAIKEYGQYQYDFSYLRDACKAAGIPDAISIKAEEEKGLAARMVLSDKQQEKFTYDGAFYQGLGRWVSDTPSNLVFIYGSSDPWYSLRIPNSDNENIKRYACKEQSHNVMIADFDKSTAEEIHGLVNKALDPNPEQTVDVAPVRSGAATSGKSGAAS